jgi:hypothetical protein
MMNSIVYKVLLCALFFAPAVQAVDSDDVFSVVERGDLKTLQELIDNHQNPEEKRIFVNQVDGRGWTLLYTAARSGYTNIVEALISAGADVNRPNKSGCGCTPFDAAVCNDHIDVVKVLIKAGAHVFICGTIARACHKTAEA